ncbi:MAG: WD40/YVTN/BNR-like repeat-containing protein [Terriglobia bacterium]
MIRRLAFALFISVLAVSFANIALAQEYPESLFQEMRWRMIGPFRGGRTRAACGVPSEPNVFYVGQVDGGVWKSDDYGRTWKPIFDKEPSQSIGAIAIAPSDPNVVYVASGEGLARPDLSVGDGIYKSIDAGKTWTHLGLRDGQQIPELAVDPNNPNRVFAAVLGHPYGPSEQRGIFRSTDGGQTWQKVLYVDQNTGGSDVEIDPSNPNVVYATLWEARQGPWEYDNEYQGTEGGIFKSTDGGDTWRKLTQGLPANLVQAYVAVSPSQPSRLYATVGTTEPGDYESGRGLGFYRSDDGGEHWYRATTDPRPAFRIGGGDLPVPKVDPKNADIVYSTSIVTWRSKDGGKTWTGIRGAPGGDDYQNIWINPEHPNIILLVSDQGAIVSVNDGRTWSSWYNQPTAQLYHAETTNTFPYRVCSGQQESGSVCISSRGNDGEITDRDWRSVGAIEYGYVAPDPLHPDIIYGAGTNEVSKFYWATGQVQNVTPIPLRGPQVRVDRTQPLIFSPVDPRVLYYAASRVFKTTDGGQSWEAISPDLARKRDGIPASLGNLAAKDANAAKQRGVVYALGPSFKNVDTLWAGTDDGLIWTTRDGGKNWTNVTPPGLTPWSKVAQITASHFDDESAYASVSRFRIDDLRPYIYRTHDGGKTWQAITSGLPDNAPVDTVREDPVRKGLLFAGTETGVWISFDDGDHWQSLQLNLPHTSMRDLWIQGHDLIGATHGRSFWILDDITPLEQLAGSVARSSAYLFKPETATRVRRDTNTDTPLPPDEPLGKNPPDGAIVDYYLAQPASGPVTIEILDAQGKLVRRYSSAEHTAAAEASKTLVPMYWLRTPKTLSAKAGMHRWVWDLHYPAPESNNRDYPISAVPHNTPRTPLGPRALPGEYTVRLTAEGRTFTAPLLLKMDPRVKTPTSALKEQFAAEMRLASMMDRGYDATVETQSAHKQLQTLAGQATGPLKESLIALEKKMARIVGGPPSAAASAAHAITLSRVNGDVTTLYQEIDRADAAPTVAQVNAAAKTRRDFAKVMSQWERVKAVDIPTINQRLATESLPVIRIESKQR